MIADVRDRAADARDHVNKAFIGQHAAESLDAFLRRFPQFGLDVVRWHERSNHTTLRDRAGFWLGVLTTVLVSAAWVTNLFAKPLATMFGGGLTLLECGVALAARETNSIVRR